MLKLHSVNIGGNLHAATTAINRWGWAEYLIHLDSVSGHNTIAIFRMPAQKVWDIREKDPSYIADPHHDDYRGAPDPFSMFAGPETRVEPVTTVPVDDEQEAADEQLDDPGASQYENTEQGDPALNGLRVTDSGDVVPITTNAAQTEQVPQEEAPKTPDEIVVPAKKETKTRKKADVVDAKPIPVNPDMPVNLENLPEWAR